MSTRFASFALRFLLAMGGIIPAWSLAAENVMGPPAVASVKFVSADALDFKSLLPPPPAPGSLAAEADLAVVRQVQAWRTAQEIAWAKVVEKDSVYHHAEILGAWFAPEKLPLTAAFFRDLGDDLRSFDVAAKKPFLRPRPPMVDPGVQPCVAMPASTSYPSGSGMQAYVWAELLAELVPAKRAELVARGERAGWGRIIGGVHFPSDIVAGRRLGAAYLAEGRKNRAFVAALEACRRELAPFIAP